ncbi:MAG: 30S ribosomal protein S3 [Chloroflexi bacterium]|nr:30S ribosomal protein S3 [Chloroflexota bacterium]
MGQKVHPIGFRIAVINDWLSKWYVSKDYAAFVQEDFHIRRLIESRSSDAGISRMEIERWANEVVVTVHTARPGIVIGRGGQRVDELRRTLEDICGRKVRLNIQEVRDPELDARLVGKNIANQIERQIAYRRAVKRAIARTMQAGAKGVKVKCSGRLGGAEIARKATFHEGRVPLHTLRADIDYGICEAHTLLGRIGVKVWIYRGDILPERAEEEMEVTSPAAVLGGEGQAQARDSEQMIRDEVKGNAATEKGKAPEST